MHQIKIHQIIDSCVSNEIIMIQNDEKMHNEFINQMNEFFSSSMNLCNHRPERLSSTYAIEIAIESGRKLKEYVDSLSPFHSTHELSRTMSSDSFVNTIISKIQNPGIEYSSGIVKFICVETANKIDYL